ncbi:porin [Polaromonas sp.]|uniref:porin n=1 Tax=Polaromonas sp. TaxID=1869339 RepID=UPI001D473BBD|nr:porin [Polaromonas sp.]MBT9475171.1 porin [Polaromonas sp.]
MLHRKQLVAAALMSGVAAMAAAQSSVTVFGKIDSAYVKKIGSPNKILDEGAQSRFGIRGTEDLGGGLSAFFWLENRFKSDTGQQNGARFFQGQSILGLKGNWGSVTIGRDYVAGYIEAQIVPDPFIHTGVSSMVLTGTGGIGTVRNDGGFTYQYKNPNFSVSAQRANAVEPNSATLPAAVTREHPLSLAASYRHGSLYAAYSYENPGGINDEWQFATVQAPVGPVTLSAGYGSGHANDATKRRSWIVGAFMPTASGRFKIAYGSLKNTSTDAKLMDKFAIGYNHHLSKRTFAYLNLARDQRALSSKGGFDVGIQHNF